MDRNSIIGLGLIGVIIVIFTVWNTPNKEELARAQHSADSTALVQQIRAAEAVKVKQDQIQKDATLAKDTLSYNASLKDNFGDFAASAKGDSNAYVIENDVLKLVVSAKGGKPQFVGLKKYKTSDKQPLVLLDGDSTMLGINLYTRNNRIISTNDLYFKPVQYDSSIVVTDKDTARSLSVRMFAGKGKYIEYVYTLRPGSYKVDYTIKFVNLDSILAANTRSVDLTWQMALKAQEREKKSENSYTSVMYRFGPKEVEEFKLSGKDPEKVENLRNKINWIAYKQQFFSTVLIANANFENAKITVDNSTDSSRTLQIMKSELGLNYTNTSEHQVDLAFYFGPNHYQTLKQFNLELEELVTLGSWIIKWINRFLIIPVFNFLDNYISNYGIIILLLTIFIKLLLFPLTYKSYLSMAKMRVLKPQIDEINERISSDKPMERQQATMQLYRKVGVSPLGGCLPLLLQMPILIAMFRFFPSSIELRQQGFLWASDLSSYDAVISWSGDIPFITSYFGNHISMFNILMTITTIITIRYNNQANTSQQFPGMKTMMYIMPVMFMFFLNSFSSGLTYYYFLANLITIIQNEIFKRSINEAQLLHQLNENKKKPVKKSAFQSRLEDAAKKRGYKMK